MSTNFTRPDWAAPLDVEAELAAIPVEALTKGMFFHAALDKAKAVANRKVTETRYLPFKDYTVREHSEVLALCAREIYPNAPLREALRQLGGDAYRTFVASMVGKVIFSVAARRWEAAVKLIGRAYGVVGNTSKATVEAFEADHAIIHFQGVFNFPDSYQVGVLEAGMQDYGKEGEVLIESGAPGETRYKLSWRN